LNHLKKVARSACLYLGYDVPSGSLSLIVSTPLKSVLANGGVPIRTVAYSRITALLADGTMNLDIELDWWEV